MNLFSLPHEGDEIIITSFIIVTKSSQNTGMWGTNDQCHFGPRKVIPNYCIPRKKSKFGNRSMTKQTQLLQLTGSKILHGTRDSATIGGNRSFLPLCFLLNLGHSSSFVDLAQTWVLGHNLLGLPMPHARSSSAHCHFWLPVL
jgi:hypothetical protein